MCVISQQTLTLNVVTDACLFKSRVSMLHELPILETEKQEHF
jgi:hypothetical protein